ncbi:MAG: alkaline phosphatase family protein [Candidatus Micrarchaeia archaeon]
MKYLLVVLDGAPDRPNPKIGNKTPLEYAKMKNLNRLALKSKVGMMYSVGKNIAPESDAAVFSILSYDVKHYTGRGPLEAFGSGLKVDSKTLALRANFATIDKNRKIIDRRAGRDVTQKEAKELEKEINSIDLGYKGVSFKFKATVGHRGALAFYSKSARLSANITNGDVGYVKKGNISVAVSSAQNELPKIKPLDNSESSKFTAKLLNTFIDKVVEKLASSRVNAARRRQGRLEANVLLIRDAGVGLPKVEPINKKFGIKFAFITEMPVETGIASLLGMKKISSESGEKHKNDAIGYKRLAKLVSKNANSCDFMYVHIKGPDEPGHDGDAKEKSRRLSAIDEGFFGNLKLNRLGKNVVLCVTADHSTPCTLKAHSADPIPVMLYRDACKNPDGKTFDERIGSKGSLGMFMGKQLVQKIIQFKC